MEVHLPPARLPAQKCTTCDKIPIDKFNVPMSSNSHWAVTPTHTPSNALHWSMGGRWVGVKLSGWAPAGPGR